MRQRDFIISDETNHVSGLCDEKKADLQHLTGEFNLNKSLTQLRNLSQLPADDLNVIDVEHCSKSGTKVIPAVSAIGRAIAFVFTPPHDGWSDIKARGMSMGSEKTASREFERVSFERPLTAPRGCMAAGSTVFHGTGKVESVIDDMSLFRGIIGKTERDVRGLSSNAPEEEGFVMIDPTGSSMRTSKDQPSRKASSEQITTRQLPVVDVRPANNSKECFPELPVLYCKAVHNIVFLADQFVSEGDKCKRQRVADAPNFPTSGGGGGERLFSEQLLASFALYLHALFLLKNIFEIITGQHFDLYKVPESYDY